MFPVMKAADTGRLGRLQWVVTVVAIAALVAGAAFAQYRLVQAKAVPPVDIEPWLAPAGEEFGPEINGFASPFTTADLKRAAVTQFRIVQALEVAGHNLYFSRECILRPRHWNGAPRDILAHLEIARVSHTDLQLRMAVQLHFHPLSYPGALPDRFAPQAELWIYEDGRWHNASCRYSIGPTTEFRIEWDPDRRPGDPYAQLGSSSTPRGLIAATDPGRLP